MLEKELEKNMKYEIKKLGGRAYKFISPGNAGVPDRLIVLPGERVYFVELKRPGEKPRKLQEKQIKFLQELGCSVVIISTEKELEDFINYLREGDGEWK